MRCSLRKRVPCVKILTAEDAEDAEDLGSEIRDLSLEI
jgi:hypothetical protein